MRDVVLACSPENRFPVQSPISDLGKVFGRFIFLLRWWESGLAIFQVKHPDAARVLVHRLYRIAPCLGDPVTIHFKGDQLRIGSRGEGVEGGSVAELLELVIVIMECEPDAA